MAISEYAVLTTLVCSFCNLVSRKWKNLFKYDEKANIAWGEVLEEAGVQVHYSIPGIKVHAKMAVIIRKENNRNMTYAYLSTGNFHEGTANVYSDLGIFTKDIRLTFDSVKLFNFLNLYFSTSMWTHTKTELTALS